ncbi:sensor histidine kinase [Phaeocystidibacter luteus]|uniref:histidine kinase n=1 Tax=Phaeocystidibacter luteus TaxID=911197 RepID=A0A6N6RL14_9FLAO|nr:HAMP domain-containing sensor histidine kinase [Phaeocystidibacter luteus]KAB2814307.1 HAMP domain-containing histidine kinase [Phaeocystidibacter luteus]
MTSGNSRLLISLISVALLGSIAVQVYLFTNAVEVRKARFRSDVMEAMRNAGEQIEGVDAMRLLDDETEFKPWLQEQIPSIFEIDSTEPPAPPSPPISAVASDRVSYVGEAELERERIDSTGFYTFSFQADTTYYAPGGPFRVEVSQEGSGQRTRDGRIRLFLGQMQRIEEKVLTMDTVLQTFVRSSVRDWVPIDTRFENEDIDSIIAAELKHKGVEIDYQYAISEGDFLTSLKSDGFDSDSAAFKVPIFRNDLWGSPRYLLLQVPDTTGYILQSLWMMLLLSTLFTIGVVATFWATIKQMLKQKKINRIKNDFINNMTHEFKTPLATINLAIDALNSPKVKDDSAKLNHYANIIRKENARMHKQVEQVLRMSLLDKDEIELKREKVEVSDWVDDAYAHMALTIEGREGEMKMNVEPGLFVDVDRHHMSNVLINILDNAIKYSMERPVISIQAIGRNGHLELSVSDRGIGMNKEVREHIFDRFYRAESGNVHTVKGHGLGLAYAKEIVSKHGGDIRVKSTPGQGSTFIITLALS